jgi:hypothetical protein
MTSRIDIVNVSKEGLDIISVRTFNKEAFRNNPLGSLIVEAVLNCEEGVSAEDAVCMAIRKNHAGLTGAVVSIRRVGAKVFDPGVEI